MHAELHLPIFKQGDDLGHFLQSMDNVSALKAYAETLESAAEILRTVAERIKDQEVEINADTHFIGLTGPDELISQLIKDNLLEKSADEEFDEDDEDTEDDEE